MNWDEDFTQWIFLGMQHAAEAPMESVIITGDTAWA